jgi:CheY-like chemotaxis protein
MSKRILWLDNDPAYVTVYKSYLEDQPQQYVVNLVPTITEAEKYLAEGKYDLLILDAMIPTFGDEEELAYPPDETDRGLKTGLAFFVRHKQKLTEGNTKVLVLTARIDPDIKIAFAQAGLKIDHVVEKPEVGAVGDFLEKVQEVLGER